MEALGGKIDGPPDCTSLVVHKQHPLAARLLLGVGRGEAGTSNTYFVVGAAEVDENEILPRPITASALQKVQHLAGRQAIWICVPRSRIRGVPGSRCVHGGNGCANRRLNLPTGGKIRSSTGDGEQSKGWKIPHATVACG